MPSFDASLEADQTELRNAIEQTSKEIGNRFDFKGSSAKVEHKDREITVFGDSDFQIGQGSWCRTRDPCCRCSSGTA